MWTNIALERIQEYIRRDLIINTSEHMPAGQILDFAPADPAPADGDKQKTMAEPLDGEHEEAEPNAEGDSGETAVPHTSECVFVVFHAKPKAGIAQASSRPIQVNSSLVKHTLNCTTKASQKFHQLLLADCFIINHLLSGTAGSATMARWTEHQHGGFSVRRKRPSYWLWKPCGPGMLPMGPIQQRVWMKNTWKESATSWKH